MPNLAKTATSPEEAIALLDDAFNKGDLKTILNFYDDHAVVVPQPGIEARGKMGIGNMYSQLMRPGLRATQLQTHTLEADGIALFTSKWQLTADDAAPQTYFATTVFRKHTDGGWKVLIDNARGPEILGQEEGRS